MAENGIFLDIFARLNLASVERVVKDANAAMREGGKSSSRAFSEGFTLDGAKAQFSELAEASRAAYRDMAVGLDNLRLQEARLNDLRANNFKRSSQVMIDAQRDFDAALANSMKLQETANARAVESRAGRAAAIDTANWRRNVYDPAGDEERGRRGPLIPLSRGVGRAGAAAAIGTAGVAGESVRVAADTSRNMQRVAAFHQDDRHSPGYINQQTQGIYQMSTQVPYSPQELSKVYQDIENHGYTGKAALDVLSTAAKTSVATGADLKDTTDGLMTSVKNFGAQAELQSDNLDKYRQGLADLNQMAGQLVVTMGNMKGVNPDELFRSFGTVEPTAMAAFLGPGSKLTGPQASAQVNSSLALLAQLGIGPEQGSHNVSRIISQLGAIRPGSNIYNMLGQLGIAGGPEQIAKDTREKGIFGPLQEIQQAINAKTNPETGMVDIGWRYNNEQVDKNIQQDLAQLPPEAQAFVKAHPEIAAGNARPFALKKEAPDAPWLQDVLTLSQWYTTKASPNKYTKKGGSTELTQEQVAEQLWGTGDIARTGLALGASAQEGQSMADQLTGVGSSALEKGFKDMMSTLPEQWKQLGASMQSLAGELGTHLLPGVTRLVGDFNSFADMLDRNKAAMDAFLIGVASLGGAYVFTKLVNGIGSFVDALGSAKNVLGGGLGKLGGLAGNTNTLTNPFEAAAASLTGAAGELKVAASSLSGAGAAESSAASAESGAATALDGAATRLDGSATVLDEAGSGMAGKVGGMIGPLTAALAGMQLFYDNTDPNHGFGKDAHDALQRNGLLPGEKPGGKPGEGQPNVSTTAVTPQPGEQTPTQRIKSFFSGFAGGTGDVHDPYSQPLMGQRDAGGDSFLGLINGKPVGLRGGEGILTPDAVARLGGKDAIDGLNAGKVGWGGKHGPTDSLSGDANPWADPLKVGTTFFGSFSQGVAKYSPFGKYLSAASHSLDDMTKGFEQSTKEHQAGAPTERELEQYMVDTMTPEQLQAMGVTVGKHGGLRLPDGRYLPKPGSGAGYGSSGSGYSKGVAKYIYGQAISQGYSPKDATAIVAYSIGESGLNPGISGGVQGDDEVIGLFQEKGGFAKAGGIDPSQRGTMEGNVKAYLNNLQGHRGQGDIYDQLLNTSVGGPMYTGGRGYMDQLYGQAQNVLGGDSASDYWGKPKGNSRGGIVGYSTGGIVGYDAGTASVAPFAGLGGSGTVGPAGPPGITLGSGSSASKFAGAAGSGTASGIGGGTRGGSASTGPFAGRSGSVGNAGLPPGFPDGPIRGGDPRWGGESGVPLGVTSGQPQAVVPGEEGKPPEALTSPGTTRGAFAHSDPDSRNAKESTSQGVGKTSSKGFGVGGGILGMAEGAAEMGANMMAPGAGQGMQMMFQLANRAIGYAGQLVGIGLEGLTETFMPHDSPKTQATSSLFGKIALGIAGAHPSPENMAAMGSALQMKPKDDLDSGAAQAKQVMPMMHVENIHNHTGDHSETMAAISKGIFQATGGLPVAGGA